MTTLTTAERAAELTATAWHEAGHVTAYLSKGLPVRYATLRPRTADAAGFTAVRRRRINYWDAAVIAHAGPMAQGIHAWLTRDPDEDDGLEECDYIFGAYLSGGRCDLDAAGAAPKATAPDGGDLWEWEAKRMLQVRWPVVSAVAGALLAHMTVDGAALREVALTAAAAAGLPEGMIYPCR